MEISWTDCVKNEELLQSQGSRDKIKGRKANWIGQLLRSNCLLKHVT